VGAGVASSTDDVGCPPSPYWPAGAVATSVGAGLGAPAGAVGWAGTLGSVWELDVVGPGEAPADAGDVGPEDDVPEVPLTMAVICSL